MQKIGVAALSIFFLVGCTTGGGGMHTAGPAITPVLFDKPYGTSAPLDNPKVIYSDQNEKPLDARDIKAINEAIAAQRQQDWAPQEEVMQELMSDEI